MVRALLLVALVAGCGGSVASSEPAERRAGTKASTAWPAGFEVWVCAASHHMRLQVAPGIDDLLSAIDLLDTLDAIDASNRIAVGADQVLAFLRLAPAWEPGAATVLHLQQWMTLLVRGSNQIRLGLTNNDAASIDAGLADIAAGNTEADYFSAELDLLQTSTGFVC